MPAVRLLVLASAALFCSQPVSAQSLVRWDTSRFDQPGQRSLFLRTPSGGNFGLPLGAGDVNGDGHDDILLCAFGASEAHLFFSPPTISGIQEAVPQAGVVTRIAGVHSLGVECAIGDVNGDGLGDLILGAPDVAAAGRTGAGAVYIVFGSAALPPEIDVTSSPNVLAIHGIDAGDHLGVWVEAADVDGDGVQDVLIGAPDGDGPANDRPDAGEAYVLFGGGDLVPGSVEMTAFATAGRLFTVYGADPLDEAGSALAAGRIDSDAAPDLVVGSSLNRAAEAVFGGHSGAGDGPANDRNNAGEAAILFDPVRGVSVDLANPPPDVAIVYGADPNDFAGEEVNVGDADGDGAGDVLIGALTGAGLGNLRPFVGEAYLVYGGDGLRGRRIDLRQLPDGVTAIYGPSAGGITGDSARFIDIDGDGREDIFIGSPTGIFLGPDGRQRTGALFFVRSPAGHLPSVIDLDNPPLTTLPFGIVLAADPGDILSYSVVRANADGDASEDVVVNGMTADGLNNQFTDAGEAYVISGAALAAALEPFASGDVNGDGSVDARDLELVTRALAGHGTLTDPQRRAADTNGNGTLDVGDVVGMVDRVLQRNLLDSGALGSGALAKNAPEPTFRYEDPNEGAGHGIGYDPDVIGFASPGGFPRTVLGAGPRAVFSLVGSDIPAARVAPGGAGAGGLAAGPAKTAGGGPGAAPLPMRALEVTFALAPGLATPPQVVSLGGAQVFSGSTGSELTVLVLPAGDLSFDRPLFGFAAGAPRLERVTAATRGGSLRVLRPAPLTGSAPRAAFGMDRSPSRWR